MTPVLFADSTPLDPDELRDAPVRYPRPSRLGTALRVDGAKAEHGAAALGLHTVGDLLEHLPRDRREARAVAELVPARPRRWSSRSGASPRAPCAGGGCVRWSRRRSPTTPA